MRSPDTGPNPALLATKSADSRSCGRLLRPHRELPLSGSNWQRLGTPFADWGLEHFPQLPEVFQKIGLDISGLKDLRTEACRRFNNDPDVQGFETACEPTIQFRTYAGKQDFWGIFALLKGPFRIIEEKEGENDGLVSVRSAQWRAKYFKEALNDTDHLNELGWWDPDQIAAGESPRELRTRIHQLYATIASQLP